MQLDKCEVYKYRITQIHKLTQLALLLATVLEIRQIDLLNLLLHVLQLLCRLAARKLRRHKVGHMIDATHEPHTVGAARWDGTGRTERETGWNETKRFVTLGAVTAACGTHLVGVKLKFGAVAI